MSKVRYIEQPDRDQLQNVCYTTSKDPTAATFGYTARVIRTQSRYDSYAWD
ncbi:MAG: hypothetical protein QW204_03775 [Thermoplasmata archaeon]